MIFKRVEVAGFKSFADKLSIEFNDGVTAIVGPNGCGKSNVVDATRWVLGEQSAKVLRGGNMQDVIFKGTEKRKSLAYCEVSLIFDNSAREVDIDYDELVITRKLYRSGQSEYLLNRNQVRLKDITGLLHDIGIGKEGYSIIGQGSVQKIVDSKPEDRRGIFEEAAGIAKFKAEKLDSERKLQRTRENLNIQKSGFAEVERQVGPLAKQSENAKKYLELKSQLRHNEINVYINQYENTNEIKAKISDVINGIDEELLIKQREFDALNKSYNDILTKMSNSDTEIKHVNDQILNISLSLQKFTSDNELFKERINFIQDQITRSQDEINHNNEEIETAKADINKHQITLETNKKLKQQLDVQDRELTDKYLKVVTELTQNEDANEEANNQMIEALEKLTEIKANLSKLETEKIALQNQIQENMVKMQSITSKIEENDLQLKTISNDNSEVDIKRSTLINNISNYEKELADIQIKLKSSERDLAELKTITQVSKNKRHILVDMQAEFEGYAGSVKKLLQDASTNKELAQNIVGVVAKQIKVPAKFETAIEIALGNAVQNVITNNEDNVKKLIAYLKQKQYGRATFLPLTSVKPRKIDDSFKKYLSNPGVIGIADTLIEFDKSLSTVFSGLLGATVVTEDLDSAEKLAKDTRYSFRIVTLEGDVINPAGSFTGGSKKSDTSNLLSRDREISRLNEVISQNEKDIIKLESEVNQLSAKSSQLNLKLNESKKELNILEVNFAGVFERRARFEEFNSRLQEEYDSLNNINEQSKEKIKFIENEIGSIDELENKLNNTKVAAGETNKARSVMFENLKTQKDNYNKLATEIRVKIVSTDNEIAGAEREIERLQAVIDSLEADNTSENESIEKNKAAIDAILRSLDTTENLDKIQAQQAKLDKNKKRVEELGELKVKLQEKMITLDKTRQDYIDELSSLNKKRMDQEMKLHKIDTDLENMQNRIYEEYELTYETCLPYKVIEFDASQGYTNISNLKREITKLGSVNINAIEEYELICERYETMKAQIEDLEIAEANITEVIKELSVVMTTKFNESFEQINQNFNKVFCELFGGGRAQLQILPSVEGEDPLDAGIEIIAQPPGKKLSTLSLLSGGEKSLTAIAILFSILKLRPMPFCILDEIEAALDDANVERFATYLRRFSKDTQFIVITHRKPTMELADRLYGVTMEEKGVSKVISVSLADAFKHVQDD